MPMSPSCDQFQLQDHFFSPGYPLTYPNNTECIRKLEGIYEYNIFLKKK